MGYGFAPWGAAVKHDNVLRTSQIIRLGSITEIGLSTNSSASVRQTPEDKISNMRRVTESTLEKASRHNEKKEGFVKAAKVMSTISSAVIKPMLQTEAVASIAVSSR